MKLIDIHPSTDGGWVLTVEEGLFRKRTRKYCGHCSVWRHIPTGKRQNTMKEMRLEALLNAAKATRQPSHSTLIHALKCLEWNGAQHQLKCPACWSLKRNGHRPGCWLKRLVK